MQTILVTGAAGFIGSNLVKRLFRDIDNIRVIGIYLGDQQTSAVVRGKIAKKKLQEAAR